MALGVGPQAPEAVHRAQDQLPAAEVGAALFQLQEQLLGASMHSGSRAGLAEVVGTPFPQNTERGLHPLTETKTESDGCRQLNTESFCLLPDVLLWMNEIRFAP